MVVNAAACVVRSGLAVSVTAVLLSDCCAPMCVLCEWADLPGNEVFPTISAGQHDVVVSGDAVNCHRDSMYAVTATTVAMEHRYVLASVYSPYSAGHVMPYEISVTLPEPLAVGQTCSRAVLRSGSGWLYYQHRVRAVCQCECLRVPVSVRSGVAHLTLACSSFAAGQCGRHTHVRASSV